MLGQIFSSVGGAIGGAFGGGILSTVGRIAGRQLGSYLEKSMIEPDEYYRQLDILTVLKGGCFHPF